MVKEIKNLKDISLKTAEGKLLLHAIGLIMTHPTYSSKTPEEIIQSLNRISKKAGE